MKYWKYLFKSLLADDNYQRKNVYYISEGQEWVIDRIGRCLKKNLEDSRFSFDLVHSPRYLVNSLIHFGSLHSYLKERPNKPNRLNKIVVTIFHGDREASLEWKELINSFVGDHDKIARIVVSNSIMRERLISYDIPVKKIALIPIGIEVAQFRPLANDEKNKLRAVYGIPQDALCLGSFQKDGIGWGDGLEPKLIKGPDVFVDVVKQLAKKHKVHVLLTGPARGFVKAGIKKAGITFTHVLAKDHSEINDLYNCLDLYLVTSREEGGPIALLESMASGVPLVTTRVGMAPDMINNNDNATMVDVNDVAALVSAAGSILENTEMRGRKIINGLETVKKFDWGLLSRQYRSLYQEVLNEQV
jgi:glycosyltransferase involved in cell wall biosynthesis